MITSLVALAILAPQAKDDGYMRWASYTVGSRVDQEAPGGFGTSNNHPTRVGPVRSSGRFRLLLTTSETGKTTLKITNQTLREMAFHAQDSALPLVQEAKDSKGAWRPIEFLPPATCGNSHHRVFLPGDHEWTLYPHWDNHGTKTRVRARLMTDQGPLYSNEIDALVGPHRFELSPKNAENYAVQLVDGIYQVVWKRTG